MGDRNLRITGPTPLPDVVREAAGGQMLSHRSEEFRELLRRVIDRLRLVMGGGSGSVLPFTASGTGGLEASVVNTIKPGERVLAVKIGYFGERFSEVASHWGCEVVSWEIPWGRAADPDELRRRLRAMASVAAVLVTHNETSTGVCNPLRELAAVVREDSDALLLVDGVSSVGAVEVNSEDWGIDVLVTASQKALMAPPGLAILAVSPRAMAAAARQTRKPYYFDFWKMADAVAEGTTTYTPAIHVIFALEASLGVLLTEGMEEVYSRHERLAAMCRDGLLDLGWSGFSDPAHASPTVTSVLVPPGSSATALRRRLETEAGVVVSQGRGEWKERMIRIGHMGNVRTRDIEHLLRAVASVSPQRLATV